MHLTMNEISSRLGAAALLRDDGEIEHAKTNGSLREIASISRREGSAAVVVANKAVWTDTQLVRLADELGGVSTSIRHPDPVREIRPVSKADAPPNTLSSRYGTGAFPFHTDGAHWGVPPEFLILHCVARGDGERPTHLMPHGRWLSRSLAKLLSQEPWVVSDGKRAFLATPVDESMRHVRYDAACMAPAAGPDRIALALQSTTAVSLRWKACDVLVINNARCLHSRGFSFADHCTNERVLKRVLVGGQQLWQ